MKYKIGFIGAGNMGGAIIKGIVNSGAAKSVDVIVYDKNADTVNSLVKSIGIVSAGEIKEVCDADVLFLAVKPNIIYSVINEIKGFVGENTIVVSVAAGQTISQLTKAFECDRIMLVRAMPNTPALVGEGMTAVSLNSVMQGEECKANADYILSLFASIGRAEIVPEGIMDAVTGVSGSSPAYVFMFIESMADAAVLGGMPRDLAYTFAAQAVAGAAKMVLELDEHPAKLKDMVCSPSGTTIEAVKVLEEKGFRGAVADAVGACIKKSQSM